MVVLAQCLRLKPELQAAEDLLKAGKLQQYIPACKSLLRQAPMATLYAGLAHAYFCTGNVGQAVSLLLLSHHVMCAW